MTKIVLLRREGMGNNCHHVADKYPGGMKICTAEEVPADTEWVVRWGTTSNLLGKPKIINKSGAIHETYDKGTFRAKVAAQGLAPRTWLSLKAFLDDPYEEFEYAIVRPHNHQRSQDIYFCTNINETKAACKKLGEGNYYISEFINKDQEWRVFVVNGRVICVLEKVPSRRVRNEVSWGFVNFHYVNWSEWPLYVVENAVKSFNLSSLDFVALDLVSVDGKAYFLEANTAPEVWPYYGGVLAKAIEYSIEHNRERIPVSGDGKNWKNYAHPALTNRAIL